MKFLKQLLATTATCLLATTSAHAFEVISAEDINTSGNGSRAEVNLTRSLGTTRFSRSFD